MLALALEVYSAVAVAAVGDEEAVAVVGDGADGVGQRLVGVGDGIGVEVSQFGPGVKNCGYWVYCVYSVGFAYFLDVRFHLSYVFGEEVQQEGVDLVFEFYALLLHVNDQFGLVVGVVVDGGQGGSEDAAALRANDEYIFVLGGLAHGEAADGYHHVLFLSEHQKSFDGVFQEGSAFALLWDCLVGHLPEEDFAVGTQGEEVVVGVYFAGRAVGPPTYFGYAVFVEVVVDYCFAQ